MIHFAELETITRGKLLSAGANAPVQFLLTDSRKLIYASGAVFFAIKGERHDGHAFAGEAYKRGIRYFVVEEGADFIPEQLPEAGILEVKSAVHALQQIAAHHRRQFSLPLIAITGSNGKTIVKEWLANLLSQHEQVVRSPKSYNSQIGVPLSVWQIAAPHSLGIFEAGISTTGEMQKLAVILQPQTGIFTNLGTAHSEGFASQQQKAKEKALLFASCQKIIYCQDYPLIHQTLQALYPHKQLIGWSRTDSSAPVFVVETPTASGVQLQLSGAVEGRFEIPFKESASIENCLHCLVCYLALGYPAESLPLALRNLHRLAMRLELKQGINHSYLIDDTYNNDLAGLQVALDFMQQQKQLSSKTVILSDLLQTGVADAQLYRQVALLLNNHGIDHLIGIGPAISKAKEAFSDVSMSSFFSKTEDFLQSRPESSIRHQLILVKGARPFGFERIVQRLQQKIHGTVLEINLDALTHNLNYYRSKLRPGIKIMVMVKAFGYGSGSHEIAQLLQYQKVDYLAVAYTDEGVGLRQAGIDVPIMVMNPSPESFDKLVEYRLEPEVFSLSFLQELLLWLKAQGKSLQAHLKLDTGMHRLGLEEEDLAETRQLLIDNSQYLQLSGIFSHLAGADSPDFNDFSHEQAQLFQQFTEQVCHELPGQPLRHLVNSAGILRFPEYHFDMVRLGIGLYGAEVNRQEQEALQAVSTLKTTISQIKKVKKGESVGYSRSERAMRDTLLATIAIGYADGYDRRFSNGTGQVLIKNQLAPIIGRVCMDMCMVDITGIDAEEGDEVIIFGPERPITLLSDSIGTIPYEILTSVGERVKRVFYTA
ncbi:bifunctional UDP-N-acetylmuramoyl-tripeptide:D-alanyl-D-alanine ligase/alanine racemase [Nafulsella turpanensis]|uniref:bifunctional UDP-N-acetylmuramoyl-tripeptide:D-alanyl-D-alanine ligase/alanine racemase n=1 Tax=Nafulsella turpanensis TaxID=1265690 RepID=UPI000348ED18|nr:bifunctional UDP-N-acetylmuramoyl-tripeptide:D-alanyl-D-alanine ligase/alanine racemase [Nafulsella turpanensis]